MHGVHTQPPRNRLRDLRQARGLSTMDVASACKVYPSTVSRWEDNDIPRRHVVTVAGLVRATVPYLDGWVDYNDFQNGKEAA